MTPMVYLIPALVVTVFFLVRAGILEKQRQIYVLKPLSTLIVIEVASLSFLQPANTGVRCCIECQPSFASGSRYDSPLL